MAGEEQATALEWQGGVVPVSPRFADPYFSLDGGLAETRHVFLAGNGLPGRFRDGFAVAELGFGTGLNLMATLAAAGRNRLCYTSFEAFPLATNDIARALAAFPETAELADAFLHHWAAGKRCFTLGSVTVQVIEGDANATLPRWDGQADAWYLDGFSPARNPELWSDGLMAEVARHTAAKGTFATYSAAGHVRRALTAAGFQVDRLPGFGRKRHMTAGRLLP